MVLCYGFSLVVALRLAVVCYRLQRWLWGSSWLWVHLMDFGGDFCGGCGLGFFFRCCSGFVFVKIILYYFNGLYAKITDEMKGVLLNNVLK